MHLVHTKLWRSPRQLLLLSGVLAAVLMWFVASSFAYAAPAAPHEVPLKQPDGAIFWARLRGDEWNNGFETLDGYTVLRDQQSGYWVYAALDSKGNLVPTSLRADAAKAPAGQLKHLHAHKSRPPNSPPVRFQTTPWQGVSGELPAVFILVQFTNQSPVGSTATDWSERAFAADNSVAAYYNEVSYGNLHIVPAEETNGVTNDGIIGWLTLPYDHPNTSGNTGDANRQLAADAIKAADPYIDFSRYDTNHDGYISNNELLVVIIVAGYEASFDGGSCGNSVWGHEWSLGFGNVAAPFVDSVYVGHYDGGGYAQFGEWMGCPAVGGDFQSTIGIMVHEIGHLLNWPDLYDIDESSEGVGEWSVMGGGLWNYISQPGDSPAHPDAFSKMYQGWITPTVYDSPPTSSVTVTLPEVESSASVVQVLSNPNGVDWNFGVGPGKGEYFLIENRQRTGFDAGLPGCGLLIWHIDESVTETNEANSNENDPLVNLMEADGNNDLERKNNRGDAGDPFPGSSRNTLFSKDTNPNSSLYDGSPSNVKVEILTSNCEANMQICLSAAVAKVVSITRADANPTNATKVDFVVTFSKNVSQVDTGDFKVTTTGGISGTKVINVSGNGSTYIVTVDTGSGDGTLRLDVPDTATITDPAGNALSGLPYTSGETYTVDKTVPKVASVKLLDKNPTSQSKVRFLVVFDEPVTDVDAADFAVTTVGSIVGVGVTGVVGIRDTYTVTVSTGNAQANGWLSLKLAPDVTIRDAAGNSTAYDPTAEATYRVRKSPIFADSSLTFWGSDYIERLYLDNVTSGCAISPLRYCPDDSVTRAQMAVFLEKAMHYPASYTPSNVAPTFPDTEGNWAEDWIEALKSDGIASGFPDGTYRPESPVTRAQMAVFLLKAEHGASYQPPAVDHSRFSDVPDDHWAKAWIEELAAEGITSGYPDGTYRPENPVSRAEISVFLVKAFRLP